MDTMSISTVSMMNGMAAVRLPREVMNLKVFID